MKTLCILDFRFWVLDCYPPRDSIHEKATPSEPPRLFPLSASHRSRSIQNPKSKIQNRPGAELLDFINVKETLPSHVRKRSTPRQPERQVEVGQEVAHHILYPLLAADAEAEDVGPPQQHRARAEGEGLGQTRRRPRRPPPRKPRQTRLRLRRPRPRKPPPRKPRQTRPRLRRPRLTRPRLTRRRLTRRRPRMPPPRKP